jgi:hypothetical protein
VIKLLAMKINLLISFLVLFSLTLYGQKTTQQINDDYNNSVTKLYTDTYSSNSERAYTIHKNKKDLARERQRDLAFAAESSSEVQLINKNLKELESNYKISKKHIQADPAFSEVEKKDALKDLKEQYKNKKRLLETEKLKYTNFIYN